MHSLLCKFSVTILLKLTEFVIVSYLDNGVMKTLKQWFILLVFAVNLEQIIIEGFLVEFSCIQLYLYKPELFKARMSQGLFG